MDELLRRLGEVQARAAGIAGAVRAGEARLPAETEGTDPSGVARVQVGVRGEPVGIAFADGWRDALADGGLGAAVVAAAQAAASARADALRAAMESEQPSDEVPPPAAPWSPPDPEALPTTALEDLAERAMAAASAIRSFTASVDTTPTTGTSTGGEVTVTLVGDQVVDCAVDAGGAQALSTSGLAMAANEELLEGAAAPILFFFKAYDWHDTVGSDASAVASALAPNTLRACYDWSGDAATAYSRAVSTQPTAAAEIQAISGQMTTSLTICAAAGLTFYVALGVIVYQLVASFIAALVALGTVVFSWAGLAIIVGEAGITSGMIIAAVSALVALLGAQASQLVAIKGAASAADAFPGGHWPVGTV